MIAYDHELAYHAAGTIMKMKFHFDDAKAALLN
jgi:hypothetical protein